jgi:hypothetical protein
MTFTTRRLAMLACSIALNVCFVFSPPATVNVGASACVQDCDNSLHECLSWCDQDFELYSEDWWSCRSDCTLYWNQFCYQGSTFCQYICEYYSTCVYYWDPRDAFCSGPTLRCPY